MESTRNTDDHTFARIDNIETAHAVALRVQDDYEELMQIGENGHPAVKKYLSDLALRKVIAWEAALEPRDRSDVATQFDSELKDVAKMRKDSLYEAHLEMEECVDDTVLSTFNDARLKNLRDVREARKYQNYETTLQAYATSKDERIDGKLPNFSVHNRDYFDAVQFTGVNRKEEYVKLADLVLQQTGEDLLLKYTMDDEFARSPFADSDKQKSGSDIIDALLNKYHNRTGNLSVMKLPHDEEWCRKYLANFDKSKIIDDSITRIRFSLESGVNLAGTRLVDATIMIVKDERTRPKIRTIQTKADLVAIKWDDHFTTNKAHILKAFHLLTPATAGLPTLGKDK